MATKRMSSFALRFDTLPTEQVKKELTANAAILMKDESDNDSDYIDTKIIDLSTNQSRRSSKVLASSATRYKHQRHSPELTPLPMKHQRNSPEATIETMPWPERHVPTAPAPSAFGQGALTIEFYQERNVKLQEELKDMRAKRTRETKLKSKYWHKIEDQLRPEVARLKAESQQAEERYLRSERFLTQEVTRLEQELKEAKVQQSTAVRDDSKVREVERLNTQNGRLQAAAKTTCAELRGLREQSAKLTDENQKLHSEVLTHKVTVQELYENQETAAKKLVRFHELEESIKAKNKEVIALKKELTEAAVAVEWFAEYKSFKAFTTSGEKSAGTGNTVPSGQT